MVVLYGPRCFGGSGTSASEQVSPVGAESTPGHAKDGKTSHRLRLTHYCSTRSKLLHAPC